MMLISGSHSHRETGEFVWCFFMVVRARPLCVWWASKRSQGRWESHAQKETSNPYSNTHARAQWKHLFAANDVNVFRSRIFFFRMARARCVYISSFIDRFSNATRRGGTSVYGNARHWAVGSAARFDCLEFVAMARCGALYKLVEAAVLV